MTAAFFVADNRLGMADFKALGRSAERKYKEALVTASAILIPPTARFDKGLSTVMRLSPFFAWTLKMASKKNSGTNARAAPLFKAAGRELHSRNVLSCDVTGDAIMW